MDDRESRKEILEITHKKIWDVLHVKDGITLRWTILAD